MGMHVMGRGRRTIPEIADFAHTGPDTLAGQYLRGFWQPIYLSHDLQRAGASR